MTISKLLIEGRSAVASLEPGQRLEEVGDEFYLVQGAFRTRVLYQVRPAPHGPDIFDFMPLEEPPASA